MSYIVEGIWRWICNQNYKYSLFTFKKEVHGRSFYMYDPPLPEKKLYDKLLEILLSHVQEGDTVYDVGAARGLYTLSLAVSGCSVYSFEPNPNTFKSLMKNVRINKLDNVFCFNIGLSDSEDTLTFYLTYPALESSFSKDLLDSGGVKIVGTEKVEVKTIDKLVNEGIILPPEHIKIDVEGFGLEVLRGAKQTISRHSPRIYFEPHFGKEDLDRRKKLLEYFQQLDYEVKEHERARSPQWICLPVK